MLRRRQYQTLIVLGREMLSLTVTFNLNGFCLDGLGGYKAKRLSFGHFNISYEM